MLLAVLYSAGARADQGRLTINLLPFGGPSQQRPLATFEVVDPVVRGGWAIPALTLASGGVQPGLTAYSIRLPILNLNGRSFVPRYGDQRLDLDVPIRSLSVVKLDAPSVRGLTIDLKGTSTALGIMVGQLSRDRMGFAPIAAPRVVAVAGRLQPVERLTVAPRLVLPIGSPEAPGSAPAHIGTGMRAVLPGQLQVVADLGTARTAASRWAPLTVLGAIGQWARGSIETSLVRAAPRHTLLGPVPFAEQNRTSLNGRLHVFSSLELAGRFASTQPLGRGRPATRSFTTAGYARGWRIGDLTVAHTLTTETSRAIHGLMIDWKPARAPMTVHVHDERSRSAHPNADVRRQVRVETGGTALRRMTWKSAILLQLAGARGGTSYVQSKTSTQITVAKGFGITSEVGYGLFGPARLIDLGSLRIASEFSLAGGTTLQLGYTYTAGVRLPLQRQIDARLTRAVGF